MTVVQCIECLSLYVAEQLDDMDNNDNVVYYVLLRAVDRFYSQMNRYPGLYDEHVELDIPVVKVTASSAAAATAALVCVCVCVCVCARCSHVLSIGVFSCLVV